MMPKREVKTRLRMRGLKLVGALSMAGFVAGALLAATPRGEGRPAAEPLTEGTPPGFRRLNEDQYKRSIEQIFGADIEVPGRFAPPLRDDGLMAIGNNRVTVTPSGIEQYELRAREIAAQVVGEDRRGRSVNCLPKSAAVFDESCATRFFQSYGRRLYRRPLSSHEMSNLMSLGRSVTESSGDFYRGLEFGLSRLLLSPNFVFRVERVAESSGEGPRSRLDDFSLATRISFLLWDTPPDDELLDAAGRGELADPARLARHVDRMIASPRFEQGVRSFFSDMLGYEQFDGLTKDQTLFPKFNAQLAADAQEQALRTIVDHLVRREADYRDLFTTKHTFINRNLGALYRVPVPEEAVEGWAPYSFGPNEKRSGILSLAGFLMLDPTHEGRSSPTIRGKSVRELLLCQPVPQPPADVNFATVQDVGNPNFRTARQRLTKHREEPACVGCHALTDPIGLSMENYDAIGSYRTQENGAPIDASGEFNGHSYTGLIELSRLLRDSEEAPPCLVQRAYEYGTGQAARFSDEDWIMHAVRSFENEGYRFPSLMRMIALSEAIRTVAASEPVKPGEVVAVR